MPTALWRALCAVAVELLEFYFKKTPPGDVFSMSLSSVCSAGPLLPLFLAQGLVSPLTALQNPRGFPRIIPGVPGTRSGCSGTFFKEEEKGGGYREEPFPLFHQTMSKPFFLSRVEAQG